MNTRVDTILPIGTRVLVCGVPPIFGRIHAHYISDSDSAECTLNYVVLLDKGFWSEDHSTYVSAMVVHCSNLEAVK